MEISNAYCKTLLLAGIVAAPLGLAGLVKPAGRDARAVPGPWPAIRRLVLAVAATTALASAAAVSLRLLGAGGQDREAGIVGVVFVSLAWLPVTRHWNARAHLCWASSMFLVIVYLTCALGWTFARRSGAASTAGGPGHAQHAPGPVPAGAAVGGRRGRSTRPAASRRPRRVARHDPGVHQRPGDPRRSPRPAARRAGQRNPLSWLGLVCRHGFPALLCAVRHTAGRRDLV
jgi:hypothetical protein